MIYPLPWGEGVRVEKVSASMDEETQKVINRLKSIEGHVRGVEKMVEEDAYCMDIVTQINAVQAALQKVSATILDRHLHTCVITAIRGDDPNERERVIGEIMDVFNAKSKK